MNKVNIIQRLCKKIINNRFVSYDISELFIKYKARINNIREVRKKTDMLLWDNEAFNLISIAERCSKIDGSIAEVGVYNGGSARLICEYADNRKFIYLFDTFSGLPGLSDSDNLSQFEQGQFSTQLSDVKELLKDFKNVQFVQGNFSDTNKQICDIFAFVHLDVDLYESTRDCLQFFYNRVVPGGIILSHDYSTSTGVKKAFDEFFSDKPEVIIELFGSQCMVVKK